MYTHNRHPHRPTCVHCLRARARLKEACSLTSLTVRTTECQTDTKIDGQTYTNRQKDRQRTQQRTENWQRCRSANGILEYRLLLLILLRWAACTIIVIIVAVALFVHLFLPHLFRRASNYINGILRPYFT